jgi:hypothetical protein
LIMFKTVLYSLLGELFTVFQKALEQLDSRGLLKPGRMKKLWKKGINVLYSFITITYYE